MCTRLDSRRVLHRNASASKTDVEAGALRSYYVRTYNHKRNETMFLWTRGQSLGNVDIYMYKQEAYEHPELKGDGGKGGWNGVLWHIIVQQWNVPPVKTTISARQHVQRSEKTRGGYRKTSLIHEKLITKDIFPWELKANAASTNECVEESRSIILKNCRALPIFNQS